MAKKKNKNLHLIKVKFLLFISIFLASFLLRICFVPTFIEESGDLQLYSDWGEKFWEYGREFYYVKDWYYAPPNYPPIISLLYGASYWMYEHKYVLPQIHNSTKLIPSVFIVYFYEHGYILMLKIWGILGDIGVGLLVFYFVKKITKKDSFGITASAFYLFNPITIFLSGVWGQTDSLVLLFGLLSFVSLIKGRAALSLPLLFVSLYLKPNFVMFLPLYVMAFLLTKQGKKQIIAGIVASLALIIIVSLPFSQKGLLDYTRLLVFERVVPTASAAHKASVSAFNFHTIVGKIDATADSNMYLFMPANIFGWLTYIFFNFISFLRIKKEKVSLESTLMSFFVIGFASFLFLTNMLERYFFAGFVSLMILFFTNYRRLGYFVVLNIVLLANIIYAFFRRNVGEIADLFSESNFLVIRILSLTTVIFYFIFIKEYFGFGRNYEGD